jgi:hypothetical protein
MVGCFSWYLCAGIVAVDHEFINVRNGDRVGVYGLLNDEDMAVLKTTPCVDSGAADAIARAAANADVLQHRCFWLALLIAGCIVAWCTIVPMPGRDAGHDMHHHHAHRAGHENASDEVAHGLAKPPPPRYETRDPQHLSPAATPASMPTDYVAMPPSGEHPLPALPAAVSDASLLEYAEGSKPILLWERGELPEPNRLTAGAVPRKAKMACMYAGFMRNYEMMLATCEEARGYKFCAYPRCRKLYGYQRKNLLETTGCDVFISTWNIRGVGRYDTFEYSAADVDFEHVKKAYNPNLAGLHVQNYSLYQGIWEEMHRYAREFPQTRPLGPDPGGKSWHGYPSTNPYIRRNDYSQSYKHWCVLQLVLRSKVDYDFYMRLRPDLRMIRPMLNPTVWETAIGADGRTTTTKATFQMEYLNGTRSMHVLHGNRMHVNNFDIGDFGWAGLPHVIRELNERPWKLCLAPPNASMGRFNGDVVIPISEYNLMLWRVVFDRKYEVDSGDRYLWVSRSRTTCKQIKAEKRQAAYEWWAALQVRAAMERNETVPPAPQAAVDVSPDAEDAPSSDEVFASD